MHGGVSENLLVRKMGWYTTRATHVRGANTAIVKNLLVKSTNLCWKSELIQFLVGFPSENCRFWTPILRLRGQRTAPPPPTVKPHDARKIVFYVRTRGFSDTTPE